jgi:predicted molibdopterin-dependent oxidoreductase YjgC
VAAAGLARAKATGTTRSADHDITRGNLCIKGRFGFQHVNPKP